ncbi:MAG: MmgE/PrpD family protein [Candidatus Dormibacteraeota bacterium]|nr:MmgE/PrpD family protein [Candidatus Dormibacteraeota bacterium]
MGLTAEVARFVSALRFSDVPEAVVAVAEDHLVDSWGVMLAGCQEESARMARDVLEGGDGPSTLVGLPMATTSTVAALLNGLAGHALDYDDTQLSTSEGSVYGLLTHPSVPVTAALGALVGLVDVTGEEFITAYVAGVEVACRVADAIDRRHYQDGFHSTGTIGTIGAAAGCARLLGLDPDATAVALGIAASLGSGLRENFGTMTKPLHSGRAAYNGVLASQLARRGFTASPDILEARRGFFRAAGGGFDAEKIEGRLGKPFFLEDPGVSIKPYPSGSLSHPAQDLILAMVQEHDIRPQQVRRIVVGTNSNVLNALIYHRPKTGLEGKFSLEYCMATGVVRRHAGLGDFTDSAVLDPLIQAFIPKVEVVVDAELEAQGFRHVRTRVTVEADDGASSSRLSEWARGYPQNPLSRAELDRKFLDCAAQSLTAGEAASALDAARRVAGATSVGDLLSALRPTPAASPRPQALTSSAGAS